MKLVQPKTLTLTPSLTLTVNIYHLSNPNSESNKKCCMNLTFCSLTPFEIQLNWTTRFEGMIKEKNIHLVIQRENVRGASNRVCV